MKPTAEPMPLSDAPTERISPTAPIDLVYLWVDGADPKFRALKRRHLSASTGHLERDDLTGDDARYRQIGEIAYSVRSVRRFAPWIRDIHIVVAPGQRPPVDLDDPRIHIVEHPQIMPAAILPTFSNRSIEPFVHRIPGLSEVFLYANDDFLFWRNTPREHFVVDGELSLRGRFLPRWRARAGAVLHEGHSRTVSQTALRLYDHGLRRVFRAEHSFHVMRRTTCETVWRECGAFLDRVVALRFRNDELGANWQMLVNGFELRDRSPRTVRTFDTVLLSFAHVEESRATAALVRMRLALLRWFAPRTMCFNTIPASWSDRVRAVLDRHYGPIDPPRRDAVVAMAKREPGDPATPIDGSAKFAGSSRGAVAADDRVRDRTSPRQRS